MKRNLFFVVALAALFLTSCLRDSDKDLLRNPIHATGTVSPALGIPVGYGEVQLNDLLGMLDTGFASMIDPDNEVITIKYSFDTSATIAPKGGSTPASKRHPRRHIAKAADTLSFKDTTLGLSFDLDKLANLPINLSTIDSLEFDMVKLSFALRIKGINLPHISDTIYDNIRITIDSMVIDYQDQQGVTHSFDSLKSLTLIDNEAFRGDTVKIDTSVNAASLMSCLPKKLDIKVRMRLCILSGIVAGDVTQLGFEDLLDSLMLAAIWYDAKIGFELPFKLKLGNLPYTYYMSLGENGLKSLNLDTIIEDLKAKLKADMKLDIDDASINMVFKNNIPLNLKVKADMMAADSVTEVIPNIINDEILGSKLKWSDEYMAYISDGPDPAQQPLRFAIQDTATLNKLTEAAVLKLTLGIATSNRKHVAVRKTDYMGIRAYVKLKPNVTIDMPLTEDPLPIPFIKNNN